MANSEGDSLFKDPSASGTYPQYSVVPWKEFQVDFTEKRSSMHESSRQCGRTLNKQSMRNSTLNSLEHLNELDPSVRDSVEHSYTMNVIVKAP